MLGEIKIIIIKFVANKCHYFKAKIHQILFRLGLSQTPLGELTALPQNPWLDSGSPISKEREKRKKREKDGQKRKKEKGKERKGKKIGADGKGKKEKQVI